MFKSDFLAILQQKLGGCLPKLSPQSIALPKTPPLIIPSAPSTWKWAIGSTGSTYNYGDFTSTNAFFWSSIDLSLYRGTDAGYTPFFLSVYDSAGKMANGWIAGVGAGETLGSELLVTWVNGDGIGLPPYDTFVSSSKDITSAITATGGGATNDILTLVVGVLHKISSNVTLTSGDLPTLYIMQNLGAPPTINDFGAMPAGVNIIYFAAAANSNSLAIYRNSPVSFSSTFTLKQVTDPPSTGIHIVSALNGTTRSWVSVESGFDPNTITSWSIYHV